MANAIVQSTAITFDGGGGGQGSTAIFIVGGRYRRRDHSVATELRSSYCQRTWRQHDYVFVHAPKEEALCFDGTTWERPE